MASHLRFVLVTLMAFGCTIHGHSELPEYLHICHKSVPNLEECMRTSVETIRPYLIKGIPELDIPQLEPIKIGDLLLSEKRDTSAGGMSITAKDIVAYGSSDFVINKFEVAEFARKYVIQITLPHLYVTGRYSFDGMILLLPVKGAGKFTGNYTNCVANCKIELEEKPENNEMHIQVKKLNIKVKVGGGRMNLENLFNGNKELGKVVNDAINADFQGYSKEVLPLIEKSLAIYFTRLANKIVDRYTEEQLFPK